MDNRLLMIAQLIRGRNPKDFVMQMVKNKQINDPNINQLIQFAQNNQEQDFANLAQQLFNSQGINLNQQYQDLMNLLK